LINTKFDPCQFWLDSPFKERIYVKRRISVQERISVQKRISIRERIAVQERISVQDRISVQNRISVQEENAGAGYNFFNTSYFNLPEYIPPALSGAGVHKHWSAWVNTNV
jgi:hypothetical protein